MIRKIVHQEGKHIYFILLASFFLFFSISLTTALPNDAGNSIDFTYSTPINYSTIPTVNNSIYWQGHTGTDGSWLTGILETLWNANSSSVARTGNCPAGQVVMNTTTSGVQCVAMTTLSNIFDQVLNTTSNVKHGNVNATNITTSKIYPSADSTTAVGIFKADGTTNVLNVDTTNGFISAGNNYSLTSFSVNPTIGVNNGYTGSVGFRFTVNAPTLITRIGMLYGTGITHDSVINFYSGTKKILTATILVASSSDSNGFKWVSIAPTPLATGITYTIARDVTNGGDLWKTEWTPSLISNFNVVRATYGYTSVYPTTEGTVGKIYDTIAMTSTTDNILAPTYFYSPSLVMPDIYPKTELKINGDVASTITSPASLTLSDSAILEKFRIIIGQASAAAHEMTLSANMYVINGQWYLDDTTTAGMQMDYITKYGRGAFALITTPPHSNPITNVVSYGLIIDPPTGSLRLGQGTQYRGTAPVGAVNIYANNVTTTPNLVVQGETSQTADLTQWQNSNATILSRIDVNGKLGIGVAPSAFAHILATTEQLRLGYDASNYFSTTVGSTGSTTFNLTGTSPTFNFLNNVNVTGNITASTGYKVGASTGITQTNNMKVLKDADLVLLTKTYCWINDTITGGIITNRTTDC